MVKAELDRDYYADLEIPPTSTANDIKKQFKKLALVYHPDRNPDTDTTAKFQAIQQAHEVLTDPQQRAKYDANRIRSGQLHTYTDAPAPPPRASAAGRSPTTNFPPPPKPPPFNNAPKSAWASRPARDYSAPGYGRRRQDPDEAKSKTNDYKAWEHMRPRAWKEPPPPTRPTSKPGRDFDIGDDGNMPPPRRAPPRHTEWEEMPDAGMGKTQRTNAARMAPKSSTFAHASNGAGDEPQARPTHFSGPKGERYTTSKSSTNMGPPPRPSQMPQNRAGTWKRSEPAQNFANGGDGYLGGKKDKVPYPTVHGEKTNLKSPASGLRRSATSASPRDSNSRTAFYDADTLKAQGHSRATSTNSTRPFPEPKKSGFASLSTSSSESSSDGEESFRKSGTEMPSRTAPDRPKNAAKSRRPGPGAPQRSFFNPHVRVEDAEDEPMAPHTDAAYSGPRRHSGIDMPSYAAATSRPEGFMEHRKKHEAEHTQQPSSSLPTEHSSGSGSNQHFMSRPKSFDQYQRRPSQDPTRSPSAGPPRAKVPIFRWGQGDLPKPFAEKPPLRSHSSDQIDMNFSPSEQPPRFRAGGEGSPSRSGGSPNDPLDTDTAYTSNGDGGSPQKEKIPPPPQGPACFFPKDWHYRFNAGTFSHSPPRSRSRSASQKRPGAQRASSVNGAKASAPKNVPFQPTVSEVADEPPDYADVNGETGSTSRQSSDGSAMDIDPVLTPPSIGENQHTANETQPSPLQSSNTGKPIRRAPTLPPRNAVPVSSTNNPSNFDMEELKGTKPFMNGTEGFGDVEDLKAALPFDSKASPTKPLFEKVALPAKLPKPPKAPTPPSKLNITTWDLYIRDMNRYMSNWANFNDVMLSHFHARQEIQRHMNLSWIGSQGDGDYNMYLESIVEDKKVLHYWEVAQDLHKECMERLGDARRAMKAEMLRTQSS